MAKVWFDNAGKILLSGTGDVFFCAGCPCQGGYDCCCDCTWGASGLTQISLACDTADDCADGQCADDTGLCYYNETARQRIGVSGKHTGADCDDQGGGTNVVYLYASNDCVLG